MEISQFQLLISKYRPELDEGVDDLLLQDAINVICDRAGVERPNDSDIMEESYDRIWSEIIK